MHQVLLLFFGYFFFNHTSFLDSDQEQNCFQIRFFTKAVYQCIILVPPSWLKIILYLHTTKIAYQVSHKVNTGLLCGCCFILYLCANSRTHVAVTGSTSKAAGSKR